MTATLTMLGIALFGNLLPGVVGFAIGRFFVGSRKTPHAPKPTGEVYVPKNEGDVPWPTNGAAVDTNDNDLILARMRGIPAQTMTQLEAMMDQTNPQKLEANDNKGQWVTRRAPHMERYVTIAPVVIEDCPDAHHVFLQVTNQRFCVTPHGCETKEEAEWTRDMLCIALDQVVRDHANK